MVLKSWWTARQVLVLIVEQDQELTLIKDIEQELNVTKSVASNLVKRICKMAELEASPSDNGKIVI